MDADGRLSSERGQYFILLCGVAVVVATYYLLTRYRPTGDFYSLFLSWRHLVCAAAFGIVCRALEPKLAAPLVAVLSGAVILAFFGTAPLLVYSGQALAVYIGVILTWRRAPLLEAIAVVLVLLAGLYVCWQTRGYSFSIIGLWVYALFRHISFAVDVRRGATPTFSSFLCYTFYYPALLQTEQYADFSSRNLVSACKPEYLRAGKRLLLGWLKITAAVAIPYSFNDVLAIASFFAGWGTALIVYVKAVIFVTGAYDCIQGVASLHGFSIRENFPGVLLAENPSMFWRRWRATMTDFFITYIYIPLGGREHRSRNIIAVFVCSVLWHWIGVPFFGGTRFYPYYLPTLLFGLWNAGIMVVAWHFQKPAQAANQRNRESVGYREFKVLATAIFGSMTINLLAYTPASASHVLENMKVLFPLFPFLRGLAG